MANHSLFHSRKTAVPEYFKDLDVTKLPMSKHKLVQLHEWSGRMVGERQLSTQNVLTIIFPESLHCLLCASH